MLNRKYLRAIFIFSLGLSFTTLFAAPPAAVAVQTEVPNPVKTLSQASNSTTAQLDAFRVSHKIGDDAPLPFKPVAKIIETTLLPLVDLNAMSKRTIGPVFDKASAAEQLHFKQAFKTLLINTYAVVLMRYKNQQIQFFRFRGDYQDLKQVSVKGQIIFPDTGSADAQRPPIDILYTLILDPESHQWKIADLSVAGVSLAESFKAQFTDELNKVDSNNIQHLLTVMDSHNKEFSAKMMSPPSSKS